MNSDWINFLKSNNAYFADDSEIIPTQSLDTICALNHLAILKVSGDDTETFLQGQLCCNIKELNETKSFFTAFCNAKGRTISTLLIIKTATDYLLVLPTELIDKVCKKLQMYIMRSKVQLSNISNEHCLIAVQSNSNTTLAASMPGSSFAVTQESGIVIRFPLLNPRYLFICPTEQAITLWNDISNEYKLTPCSPSNWIDQDISAGIPWLNQQTSEEYIPQMLNIDKLGGISFNKGCYTGQEIIARTHYLGKTKRELYLAYCDNAAEIENNTQIVNNNEQTVGKILSLQAGKQHTKMLIVMQSADTELKNLMLNNSNQDKINLIDFE